MNPAAKKQYEQRINTLRGAAEILGELAKEKPKRGTYENTRQVLRSVALRIEAEYASLLSLARAKRRPPIKAHERTRVAFTDRVVTAQDVEDYDMEQEAEMRDHDPDIHNGSD